MSFIKNKTTVFRLLYIPTGKFICDTYYEEAFDGWIDVPWFKTWGAAHRALERYIVTPKRRDQFHAYYKEEFEIFEDEI